MEPLIFPIELLKYFFAGYLLLLLGRAVAARIAGPHAELVLGTSLITISIPPLPRRSDDDGEEDDEETGNRETLETPGNTRETAGETPDLTVAYAGEQHLVPRMSREEYHELVNVRLQAIGLLDRCVKYYRDNQIADDGIIPRYDKIHMKAEDRGKTVDDLWESGYIIKNPNKTSTDPAYFPTCASLMQAIIDKRARVYPMGYLERKRQIRDSAVMALPEAAHDNY